MFELVCPVKDLGKGCSVTIYGVITDIYFYDFDHVFLDSNTLPWITAFFVTFDYKSTLELN